MTPAQAKQVFGRTTVGVQVVKCWNAGGYVWTSEISIGDGEGVLVLFSCYGPPMTPKDARRHARAFFKKLGLKVRFV